jgi:predicted enzyme related to lactoylglutathione lyase
MANRWTGITIDCVDPSRLAMFWSMLLDRPISEEHSEPGWATVGSRRDDLPRLTFQHVPERKSGKVRIHVDVQVDDIDAGRAQVERLGGHDTGRRYDYPDEGVVCVMTDPEGHEFCLVQYLESAAGVRCTVSSVEAP